MRTTNTYLNIAFGINYIGELLSELDTAIRESVYGDDLVYVAHDGDDVTYVFENDDNGDIASLDVVVVNGIITEIY